MRTKVLVSAVLAWCGIYLAYEWFGALGVYAVAIGIFSAVLRSGWGR